MSPWGTDTGLRAAGMSGTKPGRLVFARAARGQGALAVGLVTSHSGRSADGAEANRALGEEVDTLIVIPFRHFWLSATCRRQ